MKGLKSLHSYYCCATFQWPYDKRVATPLAPKRTVFLKNDINNFCSHRKYDRKLFLRFSTQNALFFGQIQKHALLLRPVNKAMATTLLHDFPRKLSVFVIKRINNFWLYLGWLQKLLMPIFKKTFRLGVRGVATGMSYGHWNVAQQ